MQLTNKIFFDGSFDELVSFNKEKIKPSLAFKVSVYVDDLKSKHDTCLKIRDEITLKYGKQSEENKNYYMFEGENKVSADKEFNDLIGVSFDVPEKISINLSDLKIDISSETISKLKPFITFIDA